MSKPIFAFAMSAVVTMPNLNGTRGKITSRTEHAEAQSEYFVEALPGSQRAPKAWLSESELQGAQPPEPVVAPVAPKAKVSKRKR
jgi:hypothetical protein